LQFDNKNLKTFQLGLVAQKHLVFYFSLNFSIKELDKKETKRKEKNIKENKLFLSKPQNIGDITYKRGKMAS